MGTIFHGNQPYSGGGVLNIVHRTWAQYQALSEAEKHDAGKYYFVPDAPAQGVPGVVAELQDEVDTINSNIANFVNITPEITNAGALYRFGAMRILVFNGNVVGANGVLGNYTLPVADRPIRNVYNMAVGVSGGKFYTGYVIASTAGVISCRYYLTQTSTDAIFGQGATMYGTVIWFVEN